jgi:NADPH:quinone reductase
MDSKNRLLRDVSPLIDLNVHKTTLKEVVGPLEVDTLQPAYRLVETGRTIGQLVLERLCKFMDIHPGLARLQLAATCTR